MNDRLSFIYPNYVSLTLLPEEIVSSTLRFQIRYIAFHFWINLKNIDLYDR